MALAIYMLGVAKILLKKSEAIFCMIVNVTSISGEQIVKISLKTKTQNDHLLGLASVRVPRQSVPRFL